MVGTSILGSRNSHWNMCIYISNIKYQPDKSLNVRHNDVLRRQLGIRFQEFFFGLLAVDQRTDLVVSILSYRAILEQTWRSFSMKCIGKLTTNGDFSGKTQWNSMKFSIILISCEMPEVKGHLNEELSIASGPLKTNTMFKLCQLHSSSCLDSVAVLGSNHCTHIITMITDNIW